MKDNGHGHGHGHVHVHIHGTGTLTCVCKLTDKHSPASLVSASFLLQTFPFSDLGVKNKLIIKDPSTPPTVMKIGMKVNYYQYFSNLTLFCWKKIFRPPHHSGYGEERTFSLKDL